MVDLKALREDVERWEASIPRVDGTVGTSEYVAAAYRMAALVRAVLDAPVVWWCWAGLSEEECKRRDPDSQCGRVARVRIGDEP